MSAQRQYPPPIIQKMAVSPMEEESSHQKDFAPVTYCRMLKGDARAALFLTQIVYHQHSQKDEDGWFWHTAMQWEDELGFSSDVEARCCKTLIPYGLETCVKRVNGFAIKHYRINEIILQQQVQICSQTTETGKAGNRDENTDSKHAESEKTGNRDKCTGSDIPAFRENRIPLSEKTGSRFPRKPETYKDKTTKEIDQRDHSDAIASAANISQTTISPPPKKKSSKTRREPKPLRTEEEAALNTYRSQLLGFIRTHYGGFIYNDGREAKAIERLFNAKITIDDVMGCFQATLLDPYWQGRTLRMEFIEDRIATYLKCPEGYRKAMQKKNFSKGDNHATVISTKSTITQAPAGEYPADNEHW